MDNAQVAEVQVEATPVENVEIQNEVIAEPVVEQAAEPVVQEKMIPQSQVSKIAAREARQAAEKARNETLAEIERQKVNQDVAPQASQMGGIQQLTPEQIEQHIMAAAHRMATQQTANKITNDFESKIKAEIAEDPDFGDLYDSLNIAQHPELVIWMNGMDNSAKVVKDLANNPAKFANILMLAKSGLGSLAQKELVKLSESIKTNVKAAEQPKAKEPLNQLSPSSIGTDNGEMSVSDYQKLDWLRG